MANLGLALLERHQRTEAMRWLQRAAAAGVGSAQQKLQELGHRGPFPPAIDYAALMLPAPVGVRGQSKVCQAPLVS